MGMTYDPCKVSAKIRAKIPRPNRVMAPVQWFGGKGRLTQHIVPLIPRKRVYVEPFCGAASVLFANRPHDVEVLNDLNGDLVNLFRVLQDPKTFEEFAHRITWTLYSYEEFRKARRLVTDDPVLRAWAFYVRTNMGFSGVASSDGTWSRVFVRSGECANTTNRWRKRMRQLDWWHERLTKVQIDNRDALEILDFWDSPDTVFYLDPPYVLDTRKSGGYEHECTDDFHERLIARLLSLQGCAVVSGYAHSIYEPLTDAGWHRIDIKTASHAAGKIRGSGLKGDGMGKIKLKRVESIWVSPAAEMQGRLF